MRILLANPPWEGSSCRAGSRWAHRDEIRDPKLIDRIVGYLDNPRRARLNARKSYKTFPLFMAQAAAILEVSGFEVKVIDSIATDQPEDRFLEEVREFGPDLCVFETSTASFRNDLGLLKKVKKQGCLTAMCGPHVSSLPGEALGKPFVDFVMIGEYELVLENLASALQKGEPTKGIRGLAFRDPGGRVKVNPRQPLIEDLDSLPMPAYHLMPMERYWTPYSGTGTSMEIMATRGCPFKCTYCVFPQIVYNSPRVRVRSPGKVVDEIELLMKEHGKEGVYFNDDTFTLGKNYVLAICDEIRKRKLKLKWGCFGRVDTVDRDMLEVMKDTGCVMIKYGVESGSQKILDNVRKGITLDKVRKAFRMTKDAGIGTHATLMIGLPGETPETVEETLDFVKEIDPDTTVWALLTPFPGTRLFEEAREKGWIETMDWDKYDGGVHAVMRTEAMSARDIESAWEYVKNEWALHRQRRKSQIRNFFRANLRESGAVGTASKAAARSIQVIREMKSIKRNRPKSA